MFALTSAQLWLSTGFAMLAFAANSLLCRLALRLTTLDPMTFTSLRLCSGALVLAMLMRWKREPLRDVHGTWAGSWWSGAMLFGYAAAFSLAYLALTTGTGALILFGAVQATMILTGLWRGERLRLRQTLGLGMALSGLVWLMLPGVSSPPLWGSLLMLGAGICWGVYSLRGRGVAHPTLATAGNFLRSLPFMTLLFIPAVLGWLPLQWDAQGVVYALLSGGIASGLGYAVWYQALRGLAATQAAGVQLCVPVLASLAGALVLGETITWRLLLLSLLILSGIALMVWPKKPPQ